MQQPRRVCVLTNGCPENRIDARQMTQVFLSEGWTEETDYRKADLVLFNACGLTADAQESSIEIVRHLQSRMNERRLLVCGCLPKINLKRLRDIYGGETFGSDDIDGLAKAIGAQKAYANIRANKLHGRILDVGDLRRFRIPELKKLARVFDPSFIIEKLSQAYYRHLGAAVEVFSERTFCIKASNGCLNNCSFCGVKISRGDVRSRAIEDILQEFDKGLGLGYREIALIGTDLGSYGRDIGLTLADLLAAMLGRSRDCSIKVRNVNPRFLIEMLPSLIEPLRTGRIPFLGSAMQSGNQRIINLMGRGHSIEDFRQAILTIRKVSPKTVLRTQIMVGFPTETDEEFRDTLRVLDDLRFDFVETYMFQSRPQTAAAAIEPKVPAGIAKRRYKEVLLKVLLRRHGRRLGHEQLSPIEDGIGA